MHFLIDIPQRLSRGASPTFARMLLGDGTAALPSYTFASDLDTGFWHAAANQIGTGLGGVTALNFLRSGSSTVLQNPSGSGYLQLSDGGLAAIVGGGGGNVTVNTTASVDITAAGTNQNITLTPSGTGKVLLSSATAILQLGGATSSFPALKRTNANLEARLADDSAFTNIYLNDVVHPTTGQTQWSSRGSIVMSGDGAFVFRDNAATGFNAIAFGGATSSFPALRRSGQAIVCALGDNSAYADIYPKRVLLGGSVVWESGSGSPEGAITAVVGSLYSRTNGGASTTLYVKESGAGNTGWIAK